MRTARIAHGSGVMGPVFREEGTGTFWAPPRGTADAGDGPPSQPPSGPPPEPPSGSPSRRPAARRRRPRADCEADSAGGLTFDVEIPAPAVQNAALLLKRRGGAPEGPAGGAPEGPAGGGEAPGTVRLPLTPAGTGRADGHVTLRAALPGTLALPEGRWDAYLALPGAMPRRLLPGVHDLRALTGRVMGDVADGAGRLGVRIPYATKNGNLTVRSWLRWPHAEAGELSVGQGAMVLRGTLHGAGLGEGARLEAWERGAESASPVVAGTLERGAHAGEFTAAFAFAGLPASPPAAAPGVRVWDLWVRPREEAEPMRLARILDDVPDKKRIFVYPSQYLADACGGRRTVVPYYTLANGLSLRVSWAEGPHGAAAAGAE